MEKTFETITFPSGVYDYEDINNFIHNKIGKIGDTENYGFNILFDLTTFKVFIKLDENYQLILMEVETSMFCWDSQKNF